MFWKLIHCIINVFVSDRIAGRSQMSFPFSSNQDVRSRNEPLTAGPGPQLGITQMILD